MKLLGWMSVAFAVIAIAAFFFTAVLTGLAFANMVGSLTALYALSATIPALALTGLFEGWRTRAARLHDVPLDRKADEL